MRYLAFILLFTLLTACGSDTSKKAANDAATTTTEPSLVCAQQSDWFYEGYSGKPKMVVRRSTTDTTVGWDITKARSYDVQTSYYNAQGYMEKKTVAIYVGGQLLGETTHTVQGINPRVETVVNAKGVETVDSMAWHGDKELVIKQYQQIGGKKRLMASTVNTLDARCMVANTKSFAYEWEGNDMVLSQRHGYDYAQLPDTVQAARLKYGNAYIYHGHLYNTTRWDDQQNPLQLSYENSKGLTRVVMEYTYY